MHTNTFLIALVGVALATALVPDVGNYATECAGSRYSLVDEDGDGRGYCAECHCASCPDTVEDEEELNTCEACPADYYLNTETSECHSCPWRCADECVDMAGEMECTACEEGYYLGQWGCEYCEDACTTDCPASSEGYYCEACMDGYYLVVDGDSTVGHCQECIEGAVTECPATFDGDAYATECMEGYFVHNDDVDGPGGCEECDEHCTTACPSQSQSYYYCMACMEGYYLYTGNSDDTGSCERCPSMGDCPASSDEYLDDHEHEGCHADEFLVVTPNYEYCSSCDMNCADSCPMVLNQTETQTYSSNYCTSCMSGFDIQYADEVGVDCGGADHDDSDSDSDGADTCGLEAVYDACVSAEGCLNPVNTACCAALANTAAACPADIEQESFEQAPSCTSEYGTAAQYYAPCIEPVVSAEVRVPGSIEDFVADVFCGVFTESDDVDFCAVESVDEESEKNTFLVINFFLIAAEGAAIDDVLAVVESEETLASLEEATGIEFTSATVEASVQEPVSPEGTSASSTALPAIWLFALAALAALAGL